MKTAVIYARYSSERQTEQSIEGQLRVCQDYADRNNLLIVDTYIDRAMTGTNDNRKDFQRMLKDSSKQAWDYVLVYKLDRFSRNKYEMAMHKKTLRDNGIKLLSAMENIPDTPEGIILESLLEGMAEYYSAELSQKVKRGMNESRQKGNYLGGYVLYGYYVENKKVYIDEEKAKVVRYIFECYASGIYVKFIIDELTRHGILNKGKPFAKNTVYQMLANEKYLGIVRHNNEIFRNIYPQIVPDDLFNLVKNRILENKYGKHKTDVLYLLKNKITCGYCGKPIGSDSGTSRKGSIIRYYKCSNRKKGGECKKSIVRKELLENLVTDTTLKIFNSQENIKKIASMVYEKYINNSKDDTIISLLIKEKANKSKAIANLLSCMEQGIITESTKNRIEQLENELKDIENQITLAKFKSSTEITKENIYTFIKNSLKKDSALMLKLLINKIILYDDKIEIYYNYIDTDKKPDEILNHQAFCLYHDFFKTIINSYRFGIENHELIIEIWGYIN